MARGRKPKYVNYIILKNINAREILKRQKKGPEEKKEVDIITYVDDYNTPSTQVTSISKTYNTHFFREADENKITMLDYINAGCLPERTDLCCRYDGQPFSTAPIGIPIKYINTSQQSYFLTFGVFCSFPCCLAFLRDNGHKMFFKKSESLLYNLYYKLYGKEMVSKAAPELECLKIYGGILSVDEFRASFCSKTFKITPNIKT